MKSIEKNIVLLLVFLFLIGIEKNIAQENTYNEQITVVAPYEPIIPDAFKIETHPYIQDTSTNKPEVDYIFNTQNISLKTPINKLPSIKITSESKLKPLRSYIKGGIGNYKTIYGEIFYASKNEKALQYNLRLKHHSSAGKIENLAPPKNTNNFFEANANYYTKNHVITSKINYNRNSISLYGFYPEMFTDTINFKDIKQLYQNVNLNVGFSNLQRFKNTLNHAVSMGYSYTAGNSKQIEHNFNIGANFFKDFSLLNIVKDQTIGISTGYKFYNQANSSKTTNSGVFTFKPYINIPYSDRLFLSAGLQFDVSHDTITKLHFYPSANAQYQIIPDKVKIYADIKGSTYRNNLNSTLNINPYISSVVPWLFTNNSISITSGINSKLYTDLTLNAGVSYSSFKNYGFYKTDEKANYFNSFLISYDKATQLKLFGNVAYNFSQDWLVTANLNYNIWNAEEEIHPWYKPKTEADINIRYNIEEKIILQTNIYYKSKMWANSYNVVNEQLLISDIQLPHFVNLNFGAEYRFSGAFSAWINIDNILNKKSYSFDKYQNYGFNILGGLSYSF